MASDPLARPWIPPLLRRMWRDTSTLQVGVDTDRAITMSDLHDPERALIAALDGRHTETEALAVAAAAGGDAERIRSLLEGLRRTGVLVNAPTDTSAPALGPAEADRLYPDVAALSFAEPVTGTPAGAALRGRRAASVVVLGATRVGVVTASLVAASGVGRVSVVDEGTVHVSDAVPGGLLPRDEGRPRREAAAAAIRRAAPNVDTSTPGTLSDPDFVVLSEPWPRLNDINGPLHAMRTPHLAAAVRESAAVIGPLVLPGRSSCLRCQDHHRADRDAAWPALVTQLRYQEPRPAEAGETPLAMLCAALACVQVLAHVDGVLSPLTLDATLELAWPDWQVRRRSWTPHPRCGCLGRPTDGRRSARERDARPVAGSVA